MHRLRLQVLLLPVFLSASVATAQWSTPVLTPNVNSPLNDHGPCLTFDGLTLYFSNYQISSGDFYRATRTTPYGSFGPPVHIPELASAQEDWTIAVRIDDLEVFFSSQRPGGGGGGGAYDLWRADRPSTSVPFNTPVPVLELNSASFDYAPSLTIDGLRIYFTSNRPGGLGDVDTWTATRPNWSSPFGTPVPVPELNSPNADRDTRVSADNLAFFFTSNRPGGVGGDDIWMATRLDPSAPFSTPINLTALNSSSSERNMAIANFYDEMIFTSSRPGGLGGPDLYTTRFTGLLGSGFAGPGSAQSLRFSDPSSPGFFYVAAASRGSSPGIPIGTRVLPLNFDLLFQLTIGGLPPILTGYVGALDRDGIASGQISFVRFPEFRGLRFFNAFVVLDPAAPLGIKTISNAHEVLVQ